MISRVLDTAKQKAGKEGGGSMSADAPERREIDQVTHVSRILHRNGLTGFRSAR